jgi:hypothetical protein
VWMALTLEKLWHVTRSEIGRAKCHQGMWSVILFCILLLLDYQFSYKIVYLFAPFNTFVIAYCSRRLIRGAGNLQSHSRGEAAVTSNPAIRLLGGCFIERY